MQRRIEHAGDAPWILMANPNTAVFPASGPDLAFLDAIARGRPLVVYALHSSFASSARTHACGYHGGNVRSHGWVAWLRPSAEPQ